MQVLIGDIDAPAHQRSDDWTSATLAALGACPYTWYRTRNGYRVVAPLASTFVVRSAADGREWSARYLAWCDDMAREYGLVLDRACKDWTRIFRAPNVRRDGQDERSTIRWTSATVALPAVATAPAVVAPVAKTTAKTAVSATDAAFDSAIAIAQRMPPSVEGHGGDAALFACARQIATVIMDVEIIEAVLDAVYNTRCLPPWPSSKIKREAERAVEAMSRLIDTADAIKQARSDRYKREGGNDAIHDDADENLTLEVDSRGKPIPSLTNASRMLHSWFGRGLWRDETTGRIMCDGFDDTMPHGPWTDEHTTAFRLACEQFQLRLPKDKTNEAVENHAKRHVRNPVRERLTALAKTWDGAQRVDTSLSRYWSAADTTATRAASRVFWLGLAARGIEPGCKVDTVLILCGAQGVKKSTWIELIAGDRTRASTSPIALDNEVKREMTIRGKWIVELPELDSLRRKEDIEQAKAFVTQSYADYRSPYDKYDRTWLRPCVFVGTTNDDEILRDPTGERRWMPVRVGDLNQELFVSERDQVLAEAAHRYLSGEQHWPTEAEASTLAENAEHHKETGDPWEEMVESWIERKPERAYGVTIASLTDSSSGAIPMPKDKVDWGVAKKLSSVLRRLGFLRSRKRAGVARIYTWSRAIPIAEAAIESRLN